MKYFLHLLRKRIFVCQALSLDRAGPQFMGKDQHTYFCLGFRKSSSGRDLNQIQHVAGIFIALSFAPFDASKVDDPPVLKNYASSIESANLYNVHPFGRPALFRRFQEQLVTDGF
jgi:hypothetical protein